MSFPFILKGILKRERWAYLLGAILMGYIGMLYPPAGDMYRYAEDFNLYKELDWEYFWIFMALKFDYFLPLLSWISRIDSISVCGMFLLSVIGFVP